MGDIYSHASCVYAWLGSNENLVPALQEFRHPMGGAHAPWQRWEHLKPCGEDLEESICKNEYWKRVWIIQEFFLARTVLVWLDKTAIAFERLYSNMACYGPWWLKWPIVKFNVTKNAQTDKELRFDFEEIKAGFYEASMMALLNQFSDSKCEDPRDRILSLRAMCPEGYQYPIDYRVLSNLFI